MQYDDRDLEAILQVALTLAPTQHVDASMFEQIYKAAVQRISERKANDVAELYCALQPTAWFVNSFQMGTKSKGNDLSLPQITNWTKRDCYPVQYGQKVYSIVNLVFGANLSDSNRGDENAYVWLERIGENKGILHSYGSTHRDGVGRMNMYYFVVAADYDKLSCVIDSFATSPANLPTFTHNVFDWKNEQPNRKSDCQPNLFSTMNTLYIYTPEKGSRTVKIQK